MRDATPWRRLLGMAQQIGIAPAEFWRLSLKEWRALISPAHDALTRAGFEALTHRFPDEER